MPRTGERHSLWPGTARWLPVFVVVLALLALVASAGVEPAAGAELDGRALSGRMPLGGTPVTLYRAAGSGAPAKLGQSRTSRDGFFEISYRTTRRSNAVLYLLVERPSSSQVRLASVLGTRPPRNVVVNERTTVATGYALAQFVSGGHRVTAKAPGLQNAAGMARNLVRVRDGRLSRVLRRKPNGGQTSTLRSFNSLANMLVPCTRRERMCGRLYRLAAEPGGSRPRGTLDAVAAIARNPWHNVRRLFKVSGSGAQPYRPARVGSDDRPSNWTLPLRFDGDGQTISGPGNFAIDAEGNVWTANNYVYSARRFRPVCGGKLLPKFTPTGRFAPGSPYRGGGVNGAGYGITLDPEGHVWVGNFGFAAPGCPEETRHNSVSEFAPDGTPLSPDATPTSGGGYTEGEISWPQGTVSDRKGNIWLANCGEGGSVTRYGGGEPSNAMNIRQDGFRRAFDVAIDDEGRAFATGNQSNSVMLLRPDGTPTTRSPLRGGGLLRPLGIAPDSRGNMWVANSGLIDPPCPGVSKQGSSFGGSLTLIDQDGRRLTNHRGGGLTIPWGISVDGDDNVWVTNFAGKRLSHFCGLRTENCPPATDTGEGIPGKRGYRFDGLVRNTAVQIDPSGNAWVTNNWKDVPFKANPGGYEVLAFVGIAAPLKTPVIGPPRPG